MSCHDPSTQIWYLFILCRQTMLQQKQAFFDQETENIFTLNFIFNRFTVEIVRVKEER